MNNAMLRPYQLSLYQRVREAFRTHRRVFVQLPTGGGKTAIFSEMVKSSAERRWNVWVVVPRNELLEQASDALLAVGVKHGRIDATHSESAAYDVHVVSKDTLIRRYDKIRRPPQFIIVDEAHLALDRYLEIAQQYPEARIAGFSATPERLDGRGLSELYECLVCGPTVPELVEAGYLSDCRYFCPPISLDGVHRRGTEYDEAELEALLERRKVYGEAIEHYRRHADHKPALVYCRSVKAAEETAHRFSEAGYKFEIIDGTMSYAKRRALIDGLRDGALDGLTSCELITYGLDVPRVEAVIMLRPTLSRTLYCQMLGRGLRTWPGKSFLTVLDHVGNLQEHGHPFAPHEWNFNGRERAQRKRDDGIVARLCPSIDFLYCDKPSCVGCPHSKGGRDPRPVVQVEADLVEIAPPVKMRDRPADEQRVLEAEIHRAVAEFAAEEITRRGDMPTRVQSGAVGALLEIASRTGRNPLWAYWVLSEGRASVNVTLLHEIARQKGFKKGWAWFQQKEIRERLEKRRAG